MDHSVSYKLMIKDIKNLSANMVKENSKSDKILSYGIRIHATTFSKKLNRFFGKIMDSNLIPLIKTDKGY